jgi:C4-dicarboxylate transporter
MMDNFDFGVSLSLYLSVAGLILCVVYGLFYWNKDVDEKEVKGTKQWEKDEQKINEEL